MTTRTRLVLCAVAGTVVAAVMAGALRQLPTFGSAHHPYGDRTVALAAGPLATANVVSSINFAQRAIDTLGEEFLLFVSVVGTLVLLRAEPGERPVRGVRQAGRVFPGSRLYGYVMLPVTTLLALVLITHGHLTPGGGFQGGVVLATAWHLLYIAGRYAALRRAVPVGALEVGDAAAAAAFLALGLAGTVLTGTFLAELLPPGSLGAYLSGGSVAVLNVAVGVEVASGIVLLLQAFLRQAIELRDPPAAAE
ncbi:MnhB domain-containing protein [Pseudonocardia acidicola]|uniref:Sodium:proton antiporter n=1 Tax=Pseudonocardia acidicola TaxID=2724939 RepID=A0ABX1S4I3_9PSEU|nr:MnhB domain-containing protein [Pseudonocardia acidicola]NMH96446.1 sodium:proton antiporter [Pseudonocardia acidicola]